jgi:sugar (pentulose or hexulose) kinase
MLPPDEARDAGWAEHDPDVGMTLALAVKAVVLGPAGVSRSTRPRRCSPPAAAAALVEQDPDDWWRAADAAVRTLSGARRHARVAAVGLS